MSLTDSVFLLAETREHPMHVGGLQLFELPPGAGPGYLSDIYRRLLLATDVHEVFLQCPRPGLSGLVPGLWRLDEQIDLQYHVRFSALPQPGRIRKLLEFVSRCHGTLLDRHRPLWEMHLIEGIEGNRFAIYTKVHHSLLDGVAAFRWMQRFLSTDAGETDMPAAFNVPARGHPAAPPVSTFANLPKIAGEVAGMPGAMLGTLRRGLRDDESKLPFQAPRSMLNRSITGARRFAAQGWPLERIDAVRVRCGGTRNDVVLAMCAGALRRYLDEMAALPEQGLIAAVPLSLRTKHTGDGEAAESSGESEAGNAIGFTLCDLATDEPDPESRLERIQRSIAAAKNNLASCSPLQVLALSALAIAPLGLSPIPGYADHTRPPFNVIISNVPGPQQPLYWNGARMRGVYPLSIVLDGQALNITVASYDGMLEFGLTGCRRSVPHLQRLLRHLEDSLAELEPA
jgi:WS/DGAT/MGAT family acyltransferase